MVNVLVFQNDVLKLSLKLDNRPEVKVSVSEYRSELLIISFLCQLIIPCLHQASIDYSS